MPPDTLAIGPNDSTRVFALIYSTESMDLGAKYRIQIEDESDQMHLSNAFSICHIGTPSAAPSNQSFKPNPLRGSA